MQHKLAAHGRVALLTGDSVDQDNRMVVVDRENHSSQFFNPKGLLGH